MGYCTRCGAPLPEGENFCPRCGEPIRPPSEDFSVGDPMETVTKQVLYYGLIAAIIGSLGLLTAPVHLNALIFWPCASMTLSAIFALLAWTQIKNRKHFVTVMVLMVIASVAAALTIVLLVGGIVMTIKMSRMRPYFSS